MVFNRQNQIEQTKLQACDAAISFLPPDAFKENADIIMESQIPLVTGSTGIDYENYRARIMDNNLTWIHATNFSMGMIVMEQMIEAFKRCSFLIPSAKLNLHEIHHTKKVDAPSGTAVTLAKILDRQDLNISFERTGDVVGFHQVEIDTGREKIRLSHEAIDRALFAEGAVYALKLLATINQPGLYQFNQLIKEQLHKN